MVIKMITMLVKKNICLLIFLISLFGCATKVDLNSYKNNSKIDLKSYQNSSDKEPFDKNNKYNIFQSPAINLKDITVTSDRYKQFIHNDILAKIYESKIINIKNEGESDYKIFLSLDSVSSKSYYSSRSTYYKYVTLSAKVINNKTNDIHFFSQDAKGTSIGSPSRRAFDAAIGKANKGLLYSIANEILPKAIIVSTKVKINNEDDLIFRINAGSSNGVKENQEVEVYKTVIKNDEFINEDKIFVGYGKVSTEVSSKYSWIVLDEKSSNHEVEVGDKVQLIFEEEFFKF